MVLYFYVMGRTVSLLSGRLHEFVSEANSSWNFSGRVVFGFEDTYTERARTQCGVCFLDIFFGSYFVCRCIIFLAQLGGGGKLNKFMSMTNRSRS